LTKPSLRKRFTHHFRDTLITGILVIAPLGVTTWVLFTLMGFADKAIDVLPEQWNPEVVVGFPIPGLGVLLSVLILWLIGLGMRNYAGRRLVRIVEGLLRRVPLASVLYQSIKQLMETLFSDKGRHFQEVVVVEYPRKGMYCLAFLTNEAQFMKGAGTLIGIFLPSTPNPTTGFYLLVPSEDVFRVNLSVEEAFKLIMSAGIILPPEKCELLPFYVTTESVESPQH